VAAAECRVAAAGAGRRRQEAGTQGCDLGRKRY